jgi:hypothetical protein
VKWYWKEEGRQRTGKATMNLGTLLGDQKMMVPSWIFFFGFDVPHDCVEVIFMFAWRWSLCLHGGALHVCMEVIFFLNLSTYSLGHLLDALWLTTAPITNEYHWASWANRSSKTKQKIYEDKPGDICIPYTSWLSVCPWFVFFLFALFLMEV